MRRAYFPTFAWVVLVYNVGVVLWGAVVRASDSGNGCGKHWPFCEGELVPHFSRAATWIEFAHRASTGGAVLLLALLAIWGLRAYPKGHPVRLGVGLALVFTFTEALLGAGLVLFALVAHNTSVARAIVMSAHLVNTLILLGSLTLTAWWAGGGDRLRLSGADERLTLSVAALTATAFLAVSGAVTALVDTLYPASSLAAALHQDIYPGVHYLIRLRIFHPFIAIAVCLVVLLIARSIAARWPTYNVKRFARLVMILFPLELAVGFVNLLMLAPMWLQITHLLLADGVWISLVLLVAATLSERIHPREVA